MWLSSRALASLTQCFQRKPSELDLIGLPHQAQFQGYAAIVGYSQFLNHPSPSHAVGGDVVVCGSSSTEELVIYTL